MNDPLDNDIKEFGLSTKGTIYQDSDVDLLQTFGMWSFAKNNKKTLYVSVNKLHEYIPSTSILKRCRVHVPLYGSIFSFLLKDI